MNRSFIPSQRRGIAVFLSAVEARPLFALGAILLVGLVLRLAFWWASGLNAPLAGDEIQYQQLAENLVRGRGFVEDTNPFFPGQTLYAWQAPLFPYSLAALYALFGTARAGPILFQILLSLGTVFLAWDLGRTIVSDPHSLLASLFAAAIVALYPGLITNSHLLLSETQLTFLLMAAFVCAARAVRGERGALLWAAMAGLTWGLATLTRGIALYFAPVLAGWVVFVLWRECRARALAPAVCVLVVLTLTLIPWVWRNTMQFGEPVLLETKGGVNFLLGNSPYTPNAFIRNVWKAGVREPILAPLPSNEVARDHAAYALGFTFVRAQPLTFLARIPVKFADLWAFERNLPDTAEATRRGAPGGWNSAPKILTDLIGASAYIFVMLLAVAGLVFAPEDRCKILIGLFLLYYTAVHVVVFGDGRFHLPLIPFLALYAGWALVPGLVDARVSTRRRAMFVLAALVFAAIWAHEILAAAALLRG